MKAFLAILRRELAERWLIPVAAILLGLVPLAAPLLPVEGYRGPDLRAGTALALALIASYLLAVVLGGSVIARDLGERRLGFYFSRPIPGWSIWAGKLASALVLALGSGVLIGLPAMLLGDRLDPAGYWGIGFSWRISLVANVALWAASVSLLILLANAVAVMIRSRSPWLLLDLAAAAAVISVLWVQQSRLAAAGAYGASAWALTALLAALALALLAASAVQVVRARTDLRRGHRLLSLTLWTLLGLAVLMVSVYGRWVLAAGPEDLESFQFALPAPAGTWVAAAGPVERRAGFEPVFLFDTRSLRYFRISSAYWVYGDRGWPVFSKDGRHAAWLESEGPRALPLFVRSLDLERPGARPVQVPIVFAESSPRAFALSPDGRWLAAVHRGRILVMDMATGRVRASVPVPPVEAGGVEELLGDWLRFLPSGTLRFCRVQPAAEGETRREIRVMDIDPGTGRVLRTLVQPATDESVWDASPSGDRILLHHREYPPKPSDFQVLDLTTGESVLRFSLPSATSSAEFLDEDRLLTSQRSGGKGVVRLLDLHGTELRRFEFPADRLRVAAQPSPGFLIVSTVPPGLGNDWRSRRSLLLDLDRGTWRPLVEGMVPVAGPRLPPGSPGTRLFLQDRGGLVEQDPATGRRRVILHNQGEE